MSFLTAEWRRLAFANYEADPKSLQPYLPAHTELDTFNDTHFVSLVGFLFKEVRVLGMKIPYHVTFEEVNLRFYVRYKLDSEWRRGVVFVKEIVPRRAIVWVANTLYNERYERQKMSHLWTRTNNQMTTEYRWFQKNESQFIKLQSTATKRGITSNSEDEFITEHYWGYSKKNSDQTIQYQVTHPKWDVYDVLDHDIQADFAQNYGENFGYLNTSKPTSVMLAEGSAITIESKSNLK